MQLYDFGDDGVIWDPYMTQITKANLVYLVLEFVEGDMLFSYCKSLGRIDEEAARFFFRQLINTLVYLSDQGIAHRDLKLENIIVDPQNLQVKLVDFGYASFLQKQRESPPAVADIETTRQ